ncbi:SPARC-like protein 1 [Stegostoma tigrinum]|uniref:SPARC-like protein 1 n=1 Tax=Stegostoma tigrinum TaxID=3053191 RepID=UPI00202B59D3|nr:SPARC-like protein 1 [Stegostoma tigrinum]
MQTTVFSMCLVAMAFANPVRKARDVSTSMESQNFNQLNPLGDPFLFRNLGPYGRRHNSINRFLNTRLPYYNFNGQQFPFYNPNQRFHYFPGQQFPFYNPNQQYPYNGNYPNQRFPYYQNFFPTYPVTRQNVLGVNVGQMDAPSMSMEDTTSMEDNLITMPFGNVPFDGSDYGVPFLPGNEDPFLPDNVGPFIPDNEDPFLPGNEDSHSPDNVGPVTPDNEDPFLPGNEDSHSPDNVGPVTPSVDTNTLDVGVDQLNSQEPATDVSNPEQPVLPYSESVQGVDSLGSDVEGASVISESNKGMSRHNTISEPTRLGINHDGYINNEQFANQQMSNGNLDEGDQAEQDEIQDIVTNTMGVNPLASSQDNDGDELESNFDVVEANEDELDSQEQDTTQSNEEDLNEFNDINAQEQDTTQSNEEDLNEFNDVNAQEQDTTQSNEEDLNEFNLPGSNDDEDPDLEDNNSINSFTNGGTGINRANTADSNLHDNEVNGINFSENNGTGINPVGNGDGANEDAGSITNNIQNEVDSCKKNRCRHGRVCKINEIGTPTCICQDVTTCPINTPEFAQVCGTNNRTYRNPCEFFASKCHLEETKEEHNIHLDYMGPCKYIAPCMDNELIEFPLRLRDWLKNILIHVYEQSPGLLSPKERTAIQEIYNDEQRLEPGDYSLDQLSDDFNRNYHMYIYPVHWQFQQLDQHPIDGYLSHSELAPLRTTLVPLEHCSSDFFTGCDLNRDRGISLSEWGTCFGIKEEDLNPNFTS